MAKIDKLQRQAEEHLEPGEEIGPTVLGAYETKILGQDSARNGILMATDRRLVFYAKKLGGYDLEMFPYANISSIEMSKGMVMGHKISFFASGNKVSMKWIHVGDIKGLVATAKDRMKSGSEETQSAGAPPAADPAAQLQKLAELLESGLITDDEFNEKRKQILNRI